MLYRKTEWARERTAHFYVLLIFAKAKHTEGCICVIYKRNQFIYIRFIYYLVALARAFYLLVAFTLLIRIVCERLFFFLLFTLSRWLYWYINLVFCISVAYSFVSSVTYSHRDLILLLQSIAFDGINCLFVLRLLFLIFFRFIVPFFGGKRFNWQLFQY